MSDPKDEEKDIGSGTELGSLSLIEVLRRIRASLDEKRRLAQQELDAINQLLFDAERNQFLEGRRQTRAALRQLANRGEHVPTRPSIASGKREPMTVVPSVETYFDSGLPVGGKGLVSRPAAPLHETAQSKVALARSSPPKKQPSAGATARRLAVAHDRRPRKPRKGARHQRSARP